MNKNECFVMYKNDIENMENSFSKEEIKELFKEYEKGNQKAYEKILLSNLKLVIYIAKKFVNNGVAFEDLIQEGNLALMNAIKLFDYKKGYEFSTYAFVAIKEKIIRYIQNNSKSIKLPIYYQAKLYKYINQKEELEKKLYKKLTINQISEYLGIDKKEVEEYERNLIPIMSLDLELKDDPDSTYMDFIMDQNVNIEEEIIHNNMKYYLNLTLSNSNLTEKEEKVMRLRYNIDGEKSLTLEEVGKICGFTKARAQMLEKRALTKIRHNKEILKYLKDEEENKELLRK